MRQWWRALALFVQPCSSCSNAWDSARLPGAVAGGMHTLCRMLLRGASTPALPRATDPTALAVCPSTLPAARLSHTHTQELQIAGVNFKAFDLGGHEIARKVWKDYYAKVRWCCAVGWVARHPCCLHSLSTSFSSLMSVRLTQASHTCMGVLLSETGAQLAAEPRNAYQEMRTLLSAHVPLANSAGCSSGCDVSDAGGCDCVPG